MTKFLSQSKTVTISLVTSALLMSGSAFAKGKPDEKPFAPGKPGDATILAIAEEANVESGEFSYLFGAVGCLSEDDAATVVGILSGTDKYTLFAPTDTAFMNLQMALGIETPTPDATCALGGDTVFKVLAYHLTEGRRFSNSVFNTNNPKIIETLIGQPFTAQVIDEVPVLNDFADQEAGIVDANLNASNGVVHIIDTVLLPNLSE